MTDNIDEVFKSKRKPKNPIKFKIQLNEEQKKAYDAWKSNNKPMDVIEVDSNPMA